MSQQREVLNPSFFAGHTEKEARQASSMPGVLFPAHLPSQITLVMLHEAVSQADYF